MASDMPLGMLCQPRAQGHHQARPTILAALAKCNGIVQYDPLPHLRGVPLQLGTKLCRGVESVNKERVRTLDVHCQHVGLDVLEIGATAHGG